jgi:hypothetical protein
VALAVVGGISSELGSLRGQLDNAKDTIANWLTDLGVTAETAAQAKEELSSSSTDAVKGLLDGVSTGLKSLIDFHYGDAQLEALRVALGAVALIALLSLWFTRRLPTHSLAPSTA